MALCDTTAERSPCTDQVPSNPGGRSWSFKARLPHTGEGGLINEAISLTSMDDSSVKLIRLESEITYIYTSQEIGIDAEVVKWEQHVSMATVIELMIRPSPSNWLVRLLSIEGQVSLCVQQDFSLAQYRLKSRKNFRAKDSLKLRTIWKKVMEIVFKIAWEEFWSFTQISVLCLSP